MFVFDSLQPRLATLGALILRYSLVLIFLGYGILKFTPEVAALIAPLTEHSLLMFWLNPLLGVQGGSAMVGVVEIATAAMIALRRLWPLLSAAGSLSAAFALVNTLTFLFTTPGIDPMSTDAGFLFKDLTLLGAALWTAGEALTAVKVGGSVPAGS